MATVVELYNKNLSPHPKINWARGDPEDSITEGKRGAELHNTSDYEYVLKKGKDYFEWPTVYPRRAIQSAALHQQLPINYQAQVQQQQPINNEASPGSQSKSAQDESCAEVGEKRKFEEIQYYVNNADQIVLVSSQVIKEYEAAQAAAREKTNEYKAAQAAAQEKIKEYETSPAAEEKLSEMRIKEEERLSSIRSAEKDKEIVINNQKIRILELQKQPPAANQECNLTLLEIYKEGDFARISTNQFGRMAYWVRGQYKIKHNKPVAKVDRNDMYPTLAIQEVIQWIDKWRNDPNNL